MSERRRSSSPDRPGRNEGRLRPSESGFRVLRVAGPRPAETPSIGTGMVIFAFAAGFAVEVPTGFATRGGERRVLAPFGVWIGPPRGRRALTGADAPPGRPLPDFVVLGPFLGRFLAPVLAAVLGGRGRLSDVRGKKDACVLRSRTSGVPGSRAVDRRRRLHLSPETALPRSRAASRAGSRPLSRGGRRIHGLDRGFCDRRISGGKPARRRRALPRRESP